MSVVPLEGERGFLTEAGVASMRVIPALDEVEDGHSGLGLVLEAVLFEVSWFSGNRSFRRG